VDERDREEAGSDEVDGLLRHGSTHVLVPARRPDLRVNLLLPRRRSTRRAV
jgi:hypothetical protein